jgi:hypothetical protein
MNDQPAQNDYLWDPGAPVDPEIVRLERLLEAHRWSAAPRRAASRRIQVSSRRWRSARWAIPVGLAAMLAAFATGLHAWYGYRLRWEDSQPWQVVEVRGEVRMGSASDTLSSGFGPGDVLETGTSGQARLRVARIGEFAVDANSRVELVETRSGAHRLRLQHGRLWAQVWAPAGWFGVATRSNQVLDLGCEFLLQAEPDGSGALNVRSGWVRVDSAGRAVLVPQGARVEFDAAGVPGTPYDLGATADFLTALREVDALGQRLSAEAKPVERLLVAARPEDAISLLTLLSRHPHLAEGPLFDHLQRQFPAAAGVEREALRRHGRGALSPWWDALPYPRIKSWWLNWPDAFDADADTADLLRDESR